MAIESVATKWFHSLCANNGSKDRAGHQFQPHPLVSLYQSAWCKTALYICVLCWVNNMLYRLIISKLDLLVTAALLSNQLPIGEQKIILNFNKLQAVASLSIIHTAPGSNKTRYNYADKIQHKQKKWKLALNKTKKGERGVIEKTSWSLAVSLSLFLSFWHFTLCVSKHCGKISQHKHVGLLR